jgi:CPA2 family monovalent cation:H+ antiporter-2
MAPCPHFSQIRSVSPRTRGCEECLTGDPWLHLRLCLTCEHVGCRHSLRSFEPGETSGWRHSDHLMLDFS